MTTFVPYSPAVEQVEPEEAETIRELEAAIREIQDTTAADYGSTIRGVHAKGHGLLKASLSVAEGLPPELAQGLFAEPRRYDAVLRFSTAPGDILDDSVSSPRGLALKVLDVSGERLAGTPASDGQDFVLVNGPAFGNPTPAKFLPGLKLLAKTTDKADGAKAVFSGVMQTVEGALESVGIKSPLIATLGGAPNTHPLGDIYFSQVPFRFGDYIAKFSVAPVSPWLTDLKGDKVNAHDRPEALREVIRETIATQGGEWELRVQLCTDLEKMPIEDASVIWDEAESPFRAVARITVDPQISWQHGTSEREEADLAFSPWHGLAAFQPLGGVNRARKPVYEQSQAFRGCPVHAAASRPA
ncbi:catalase family protein [Sphingomonas sp. LM7]|uniref:catalase family protein n=1 Tax=Sphingomonas sp. LM7 TaxID=1938607 RepID=UPI000983EFE9|nr:catalase family protein [Sphingomonas sp. LM7]AQR72815.1 catalase [Sphingomonas sp. LM7]